MGGQGGVNGSHKCKYESRGVEVLTNEFVGGGQGGVFKGEQVELTEVAEKTPGKYEVESVCL